MTVVRSEYVRIAALVERLTFDHKNATPKDLGRVLRKMDEHKRQCSICSTWWPQKAYEISCPDFTLMGHTALNIWRHLPASTRMKQLNLFNALTEDTDGAPDLFTETDPP